jgi:hypothetical protein
LLITCLPYNKKLQRIKAFHLHCSLSITRPGTLHGIEELLLNRGITELCKLRSLLQLAKGRAREWKVELESVTGAAKPLLQGKLSLEAPFRSLGHSHLYRLSCLYRWAESRPGDNQIFRLRLKRKAMACQY